MAPDSTSCIPGSYAPGSTAGFILLYLAATLCAGPAPPGIASDATAVLAVDGHSRAAIVAGENPTHLERLAVRELADHLKEITGSEFPVVREREAGEGKTRIYVGQSAPPRTWGTGINDVAEREWIVRTTDDGIVLAGGDPRGTLYAVYHFLEDVLGVRWWNAYETYVPSRPDLAVKATHLRGTSAFERVSLGGESITELECSGHDDEKFSNRNRVFGQGQQYGPGPGYFAHSFSHYVPPERFEQHPEWFGLVDGRRSNGPAANKYALCLTSPDLHSAILEKLKKTVALDRHQASEHGTEAPSLYSISQLDGAPWCECPRCTDLLEKEGSLAGSLLQMINYLAAGIREIYPDITIETLAYSESRRAPRTIRPLDNVRVRVCLGGRNVVRSMEDPSNRDDLEMLRQWCAISGNVGVWIYSYSYGGPRGLPCPVTLHTAGDARLFRRMGVRDVYYQQEFDPYRGNDWVFWVRARLLENPERDPEALLTDFTEGYYGPAGMHVRRYIKLLDEAARRRRAHIWALSPLSDFGYLDRRFLSQANTLLENAENVVAGDSLLSRRVRGARIPVTRAILHLWPSLKRERMLNAGKREAAPLDREAALSRYKKAMGEQMALRCVPKGHDLGRARAFYEDELRAFADAAETSTFVPDKFRNLPPGRVFDYPAAAPQFTLESSVTEGVEDPDVESGMEVVIPADDADLPFPMGMVADNGELTIRSIAQRDIAVGRYEWYSVGYCTLSSLTGRQIFLGSQKHIRLTPRETGTHEVWARLKFDGPPFARLPADRQGTVSLERMVLTKPAIEGNAEIKQTWTVFGPLKRTDILSPDVLQSFPAQIMVDGKPIEAGTVEADDGSVDLAPLMGRTEEGRSAYIFAELNVRESGRTSLGFGADWWLQAWVDGGLICDTTELGNPSYPPSLTDNIVTVSISAGRHVLAVRFISGQASSFFSMGAATALRIKQGETTRVP